jgi:hypothetical protein
MTNIKTSSSNLMTTIQIESVLQDIVNVLTAAKVRATVEFPGYVVEVIHEGRKYCFGFANETFGFDSGTPDEEAPHGELKFSSAASPLHELVGYVLETIN